jgi:hypothetical protein
MMTNLTLICVNLFVGTLGEIKYLFSYLLTYLLTSNLGEVICTDSPTEPRVGLLSEWTQP